MTGKIKYGLFLIFILISFSLFSQDDPKITMKGYIKDLRTFIISEDLDNLTVDNLFHNRLNFKWYTSQSFTTVVELRNRIFYGEVVKNTPGFAKRINTDDYFDLSVTWVNQKAFVFETVADRLYLDYVKNNLEIRLGRQRVNWGINTVWNPNDLFNAFNYFDFDYEERPGSDAIRIQYYTGSSSSLEAAGKLADHINKTVIAGLYKFNKWNYDFQVLAGIADGDYTLGTGWAGNIKKSGFKGEATFFYPFVEDVPQKGDISVTLSVDHSFKSSVYLMGSVLYNSSGTQDPNVDLAEFTIKAKTLMPYKYTFFAMVSYPFSPIINGSFATMYSPGVQVLFLNPNITFNVAENWDLDILAQVFFNKSDQVFKVAGQLFYIRLKWSF